MTHSPADHLTIDAAAASIAERNRHPTHLLTAPGPDAGGSRTAAALRRAAESETRRLRGAQRTSATRWREISRLAQNVTTADEYTAAALPRGGRW
jgi:hypothetical protein